jgi:hypothetical protein
MRLNWVSPSTRSIAHVVAGIELSGLDIEHRLSVRRAYYFLRKGGASALLARNIVIMTVLAGATGNPTRYVVDTGSDFDRLSA